MKQRNPAARSEKTGRESAGPVRSPGRISDLARAKERFSAYLRHVLASIAELAATAIAYQRVLRGCRQ